MIQQIIVLLGLDLYLICYTCRSKRVKRSAFEFDIKIKTSSPVDSALLSQSIHPTLLDIFRHGIIAGNMVVPDADLKNHLKKMRSYHSEVLTAVSKAVPVKNSSNGYTDI